MNLSKNQITDSLRLFVARRDDLLHEDEAAFEHHLQRFVEFCRNDVLVQSIINLLQQSLNVDVDEWWETVKPYSEKLWFPSDSDSELLLRYEILISAMNNSRLVSQFGMAMGKRKRDEWVELFRTLIVRPFADEMTYRLGNAANLASPEERALQAVPLDRIPNANETRIFLSHKSVDKPLVYRYYHALRELGFEPWLDEPEMPAGANLEREIFKGFVESCAAVFFITKNFRDETYLATEVDYAVIQKRKKDRKFVIVTLRYPDASPVPDLLTPYIYKDISNDLEGFYELIRALPVELGPIRWKAEVVAD
ncbi:MAG: toll/interleukin-1 receptor domain-containing protein [Chloroflexota bacterium]|nr:toll/interleukin-1 receptor domain-containing protein [Chloroflexota bacterium]